MTNILLSRMQFGWALGFHYLFPVTTLGLTLYILIFESLYLKQQEAIYRKISAFLIKLLALVFGMGVATGLILPFTFGANWAAFARYAGEIFGIVLAVEGITAFMLESVFLGILLYGRKRVSARVYWLSALLVFFGSHLSGFWIVAANSWMQTPAGYALEGGKLVLKSFWQATLNPSTLIRFGHVISAAWLTGSVVVCGIAAWYLLHNRHIEISRKIIKTALLPLIITALLQAGLGHIHIMNVKDWQPAKNAAYEGMFVTMNGAPLYAFGIPDAQNKTIHLAIGAPYMLSFLETWDFNGKVEGLDQFPEAEWPPVNVIFTTFHLMVGVGGILIVTGLLGGFLYWKNQLFYAQWFLRLLTLIVPLPYLANEVGWIGAEMGRQPWTIYGLLRTDAAATLTLTAGSLTLTLTLLVAVYLLLLLAFLSFLFAIIKNGPEGYAPHPQPLP